MISIKNILLSIYIFVLAASPVLAESAKPAVNRETNSVNAVASSANSAGTQGAMIDNLDFRNTDILPALTQIEEKSGVIISPESNIQGKITLSVDHISLWDALKIILDANDLAYYQEGNLIKVMPAAVFTKQYGYSFDEKTRAIIVNLNHADPPYVLARLNPLKSPLGRIIPTNESKTFVIMDNPKTVQSMLLLLKDLDVPVETKVFQLRYALAQEVAEKIKGSLSRNIGQVNFDDRTNQVVVIDKPENIQSASEVIVQMDQRREILLSTEVVMVSLNDEHKNGVDWEAIVSEYTSLEGENTPENNAASKKLSLGTLSQEDYKILLDALEVVGEIKSYPTPGVTVFDSNPAYLELTLDDAGVTMAVLTQAPKNSESTVPTDKKVGFYITPTLHVDGKLSLKIKPVIKNMNGEMNKQLKVDEVTVIGGIFTEQKEALTNKFPILGDIPLLGFVFRSQTTNVRKTEYIIFIKPQVVTTEKEAL